MISCDDTGIITGSNGRRKGSIDYGDNADDIPGGGSVGNRVELEMEEVTVVMGSNGDDDNNADFCIPKLFAKAIPHLSQKK